MDVMTGGCKNGVLREILYSEGLVLMSEYMKDLQKKFDVYKKPH